jgi:small-conductance mechanosensitive channel
MEFLGIRIDRAAIEEWLAQAQEFALPRLLQSAGQILLGLVVFLAARWILARIEHRITSKTQSVFDDHVVEVVRRSASISVVAWVVWRLAHIWDLTGLAAFAVALWIVALSLPIADFAAKVLRVVEEEIVPKTETTFDDTALPLLNKVIKFMIIGAGMVIALDELDVDILPFIAGASVAGVAIGFAAKDTLSNLIAGVLLILDRPFHVGDRIEIWAAPTNTATWGDVVEIGLRATKIRTTDNLIIVIPNNEIMRRDIVNYTASGLHIRLRIPISIAYNADAELAKEVTRKVALETEGVMAVPEPQIIIRDFGESAIDMQLRVWISDARQRRAIGDLITDKLKHEFDRAGIEIPYAKRDIYIRAMPSEPTALLPVKASASGDAVNPATEDSVNPAASGESTPPSVPRDSAPSPTKAQGERHE